MIYFKLSEFNDKIQLMANFEEGAAPIPFSTTSHFKTGFWPPERSEGSQRVENTRFFASLRMTIPLWAGFEIACKNQK
jgi:hypothetical protein